jgi:hypothetical protein
MWIFNAGIASWLLLWAYGGRDQPEQKSAMRAMCATLTKPSGRFTREEALPMVCTG